MKREPVDIWLATPRDAAAAHERLLHDTERRRASAYRDPLDRQRFVVGCALTRLAMEEATGTPPDLVRIDRACPDCGKPHGKPHVVNGPHFSVTHAGPVVALATHRTLPVGLDVEPLDTSADSHELAPLVLTESEHTRWRALPPAERGAGFLRYWVRKEAVLKAVGVGLRFPLRELEVGAAGPAGVALEGTAVAVQDLKVASAVLGAVGVLEDRHPRIRLHSGTDLLGRCP